jgi:hypothetical protein
MDPTQVSRNNGFLVSIGILSHGKKKSLTADGRALASALDFELPEQIESAWRSIALNNEFLRKIVSAVRIRGGMELSALRNHVAYTAGEPKEPRFLTGAGSVVDVLRAAGLLREENGKIVALPEGGPVPKEEEAPKADEPIRITPQVLKVGKNLGPESAELSIQVRIDCKPEDLESLAPKLQKFLKSLRDSSENLGDDGN